MLLTHFLCFFGLTWSLSAQDTRPQNVEDYLERCAAFGWSGFAHVVHEGETVLHKGYGMADVEKGTPHGPDTLFEIASLTKTYTACAILALVEENKLELDGSIAEHLPGVPEDKKAITVRHLLNHTSGMPRSAGGAGGHDLKSAVADYLRNSSSRSPGQKSEYWNGGYALLAGIIQEVSGLSYQDYCRKRLFEPAGLVHTGFTGDANLPGQQQALGYEAGGPIRRAAEHPYGSYGWQYQGMGGIVTSASDIARFLQAYENGSILKAETRAWMETANSDSYGLGWAVTETKRGTRRIGHGGDVRGFHTQLQRFPDEDSYVLLLSNVDEVPMWKLAWNIEALLFDQPLRTAPPPTIQAPSPRDLVGFEGVYGMENGSGIEVLVNGNHLLIAPLGIELQSVFQSHTSNQGISAAMNRADEILKSVQENKPAEVAVHLADGIPKSWPERLCSTVWPRHIETNGDLKDVKTLSVRHAGFGMDEILYSLDHASGRTYLKLVLRNHKLQIFDLNAPRFLTQHRYALQKKESLIGFDWSTDKTLPVVKAERRKNRITALRLETAKDETVVLPKIR